MDVYNRIKNCVLFEKEAVSFLRLMLAPEKVNIDLSVNGARKDLFMGPYAVLPQSWVRAVSLLLPLEESEEVCALCVYPANYYPLEHISETVRSHFSACLFPVVGKYCIKRCLTSLLSRKYKSEPQ